MTNKIKIPLSMVWQSDELDTDLAGQILLAIKHLWKKYSVKATICYLNPVYAKQAKRTGGIRIILTKKVAKGQLFLGVDK